MLTFVTSMTASMAEVHLAIGALDLAEVASLTHRIKGAARMSGVMALGLAALVLERYARAANGAPRTPEQPSWSCNCSLCETIWRLRFKEK